MARLMGEQRGENSWLLLWGLRKQPEKGKEGKTEQIRRQWKALGRQERKRGTS